MTRVDDHDIRAVPPRWLTRARAIAGTRRRRTSWARPCCCWCTCWRPAIALLLVTSCTHRLHAWSVTSQRILLECGHFLKNFRPLLSTEICTFLKKLVHWTLFSNSQSTIFILPIFLYLKIWAGRGLYYFNSKGSAFTSAAPVICYHSGRSRSYRICIFMIYTVILLLSSKNAILFPGGS
jgi:hypothetical protein